PPSLEAVVLKTMAKKPDERYASMLQLLEALDAVGADIGTSNAGVRRASRDQDDDGPPTKAMPRSGRNRAARAPSEETPAAPRRARGPIIVVAAGASVLLAAIGYVLLGRGEAANQ